VINIAKKDCPTIKEMLTDLHIDVKLVQRELKIHRWVLGFMLTIILFILGKLIIL